MDWSLVDDSYFFYWDVTLVWLKFKKFIFIYFSVAFGQKKYDLTPFYMTHILF